MLKNAFCDMDSVYSEKENTEETESLTARKLSDIPSPIIIKCRIQYGSRWSACKGLVLDYCRSTTIHGLRYIVSVHRPIYERIFWLVLTLVSFYFAVCLIWYTFLKWQISPVILGFDETLVPIHKIPFPTVTICPEIKMNREIFNFTDISQHFLNQLQETDNYQNLENITQEELQNFAAALHVCEEEVAQKFAHFIPPNFGLDIAQALVNLTISKNETAPICKWNGRYYFCHKIFHLVATDEGICYQFNGLKPEDIYRNVSFIPYHDTDEIDFQHDFDNLPPLDNYTGSWTLESGYMAQGYNSYPQRTVFSSVRNAFFGVFLGLGRNLEYTCRSYKQGYRIFLNSPESVPLTSGNFILAAHGEEVMISVLPQYIVGDKNLREYSPEKRQCYFNDERYLSFFRYYSQTNCQIECLVNFTISKCGCAKFWMPKPPDVPVCGAAEIYCYTDAQKSLTLLLQNQALQKTLDPTFTIMCDCMPSCTSLDYNVEISSCAYNLSKTLTALREEYEHNDLLNSRLSIYFKEHQFTAIRRTVLFSITTFIANCGGIFGLFMGISGLSLIEFLYFFSMRLFENLRKRRLNKNNHLRRKANMHVN